MKRKGGFFRFMLLAIDLILAVWIISSYKKVTAGDPKETRPPVQTTKDARTTAAPTKTPETKAPATKAPATQAPSQSVPATEKPSQAEPAVPARSAEELARFDWYLSGAMISGIPQGSTHITNPSELFGNWKALLYVDPDGVKEHMVFADVKADAGQSGFIAAYDDYLVYSVPDGKEEAKNNIESQVYPFAMDEGLVAADTGDQTVYLYFYEYNGTQYASGAFLSPEGLPVYIALTR